MINLPEAYRTGILLIDNQHALLLTIYEELSAEGCIDGDGTLFLAVVEKLEEYATFHFTTEEYLFDQFAYPDKDLHALEHKRFTAELRALKASLSTDGEHACQRLCDFIKQWVLNHIAQSDLNYVPHLKDKMT